MKPTSKTVANFKESIFATMTKMALKNQAINLSQGFPDFDGPEWIRDLAARAVHESEKGANQYAPSPGIAPLRKIISQNYQKYYQLNYNQDSDITITNGATEAIFSSTLALVNPGDEVIVFEPYYDSYIASIELAGGIPIPVTLHAPSFEFKKEELEAAFSPKTKFVFLNTPHNPSGKVFNREELEIIAELTKKYDVYVVSDEVYEFLTFDEHKHIPIASLEGMKERCITISSTGKTFGLTGWKIGWTATTPELSHAIRMVHQFNTFSVCHPMQMAMAEALNKLEDYLPSFRETYQSKRDLFMDGLKKAGFNARQPEGTYFAMVPIREHTDKDDIGYCQELIEKKKVASIPPSAFYMKSKQGQDYLRFCFAKKNKTLEAALNNLL